MPSDTPHQSADLDNLQRNMLKTRIAPELLAHLSGANTSLRDDAKRFALLHPPPEIRVPVLIELSARFPGGLVAARSVVAQNYLLNHFANDADMVAKPPILPPEDVLDAWRRELFQPDDAIDIAKSMFSESFLFAMLAPDTIFALANVATSPHAIHKIWPDRIVNSFVYESARTIKCDAARIAFSTSGEGVVWAVADTGIDGTHPHFKLHDNLTLPDGIQHRDFTLPIGSTVNAAVSALSDSSGHGTHVAGIIAGETTVGQAGVSMITIDRTVRTGLADISGGATGGTTPADPDTSRTAIAGLAPRCKLLSLKVLSTDQGVGKASDLIAAIGYIQQINGYGRDVKVHGINLSLGYPFDPRWFAAGQSPLCVEVDRLVSCGVVVVIAAGNAGYGRVTTSMGTSEQAALMCTIADPGNARLGITVGSTHRDKPHVYGVSYFSAKGPTADGRAKPDIVAPGERIVSCKAGGGGGAAFKEDSGTSMAAPHVSGAIAGFLSVRNEYLGRPQDVRDIFLASATNLQRRAEFQGAGLVDIMRALQSI